MKGKNKVKVKIVKLSGHGGKWKDWHHRQRCDECKVYWAFVKIADAIYYGKGGKRRRKP